MVVLLLEGLFEMFERFKENLTRIQGFGFSDGFRLLKKVFRIFCGLILVGFASKFSQIFHQTSS